MKNASIAVALLLSAFSVGFQASQTKTVPVFQKFLVPASISELDYRTLRAELDMLRGSTIMSKGVGVGRVTGLSPDRQQITVDIDVSEEQLPSQYGARREALLMAAAESAGTVMAEFDLQSSRSVRIEFYSIEEMVKSPKNRKAYAEFSNEQLTFH